MKFYQNRVYRVESSTDHTTLIGIVPKITDHGKAIEWHDTVRGRYKIGEIIKDDENVLEFKDNEGNVFTFKPLTLTEYKTNVKPQLEDPPDFDNALAMHKFFSNTENFRI